MAKALFIVESPGKIKTLKSFLGGHIDIYAGSITPILPYLKDGQAKCLLVTTAKKVATIPQAASLTDIGGDTLRRDQAVP